MSQDGKQLETFRYGSVWLRADFHLHTKVDKEFAYKGEENSFLNDYVAKLKEHNIKIGVITNHNKFDKSEFDNLRKKAIKEEIFILPGVELSVNDGANGIHTLIVFSDKWLENNLDYINQFLNVAFTGKTPEIYEQKNSRTSLNLIDTIKKLDEYQRDYFIIFAHVEQECGLWASLDGGRIIDYGKDNIFRKRTLGFQKVRTHDARDSGKVCREKVKSWLGDWYPAEVEGSDCKSIDEIGAKNGQTWLKIGDFSFEAVKYTLADYKDRVRQAEPAKEKHSYIKNISFKGGIFDKKTIYFSPELNTLIGIRGSGKSSIIEVLRYVLDIPFGGKTADEDYKTKLVAYVMGSGGTAVISAVDRFGSEYQIKRILNEFPSVYTGDILQPGISIRETVVKNPLYFGQKDLSKSDEGFEKDLVEKLLGEKLFDIRKKIEEQKQIVIDATLRFKKLSNIDEQIKEYEQKKQDAEFNMKKFVEYGIEEKFKKQTDFNTDDRKLKQIINDVSKFIVDLDTFINEHEDIIKNHSQYKTNQNMDFFKVFMDEYAFAIKFIEQQKNNKNELEDTLKKLKIKYASFLEIRKEFTDEFAKTRRKIEEELKEKGALALDIEEYPKLKDKIDTADKMLNALQKQKNRESMLKDELLVSLDNLNNLWNDEYKTITERLDIINKKQTSLTIEGEFKGDKEEFLFFIKSIFRGSGIRENTYSNLVNEYSDFGSIYRDLVNALNKAGSSPETFEKYFIENLPALLTYQVPNKFTIKYKGKPLQGHSLGQRASALILFILNQMENDVIILDQPEDDLDNQTIYEDVIKLIREIKPKIQFIFATHNANFPVLGDAEQIYSCRYHDNKIELTSGSIDSLDMQREIVDIMEGGEEAFSKRKEIYEIWKLQN
jgi:hypothetical protein